jgi:hypothetical protein
MVTQEIPRYFWNPNVHYFAHKRPPSDSVLSKMNPDQSHLDILRSILILYSHLCLHLSKSLTSRSFNRDYVVCPKHKCTDVLFKCTLDSLEITSYLLQSTALGKLHNGSNGLSIDHISTGSHFL